MATFSLPVTVISWPGAWPFTSALGLSTRRYSAERRKRDPSSKVISRMRPPGLRRISCGQGSADSVVIQLPGFFDQHDGDAVADRVGEARGAGDQLLALGVIDQRLLGQGADQDLQQFGIDAADHCGPVLAIVSLGLRL